MEIILEIIDVLFKRFRRLLRIVITIILLTYFYYPDHYEKASHRVINKIMNIITKESNETANLLKPSLNKFQEDIKNISNK